MPEGFYEFQKLEHSRTKVELENNWIIRSVLWDEEFLQKRLEYYKARGKYEEERLKEIEELEAATKAAQNKEKDK